MGKVTGVPYKRHIKNEGLQKLFGIILHFATQNDETAMQMQICVADAVKL